MKWASVLRKTHQCECYLGKNLGKNRIQSIAYYMQDLLVQGCKVNLQGNVYIFDITSKVI